MNKGTNPNNCSFGLRLKKLREDKGITQLALAKAVGTTQQSIGRYERSEREANYDTLARISHYFEVTIDYLLGRSEFSSKNAYGLEDFFSIMSPSLFSNSIEENFQEPFKSLIYGLIENIMQRMCVTSHKDVDILLAITIIGDYYSELTEQEASNPTEYEEFLKFYAEFQQISDRLFLALLDPQFRNINSKTFYFKELLLEQGKFPSERNYDFQVLSSK